MADIYEAKVALIINGKAVAKGAELDVKQAEKHAKRHKNKATGVSFLEGLFKSKLATKNGKTYGEKKASDKEASSKEASGKGSK